MLLSCEPIKEMYSCRKYMATKMIRIIFYLNNSYWCRSKTNITSINIHIPTRCADKYEKFESNIVITKTKDLLS